MGTLDTTVRNWRRRFSREVLAAREWQRLRTRVPELGDRHMLANWFRDEDDVMIDLERYGQLLSILPDRIAGSLEHARNERAGRAQILKAGLGYVEMLSSVIVDGTAVHDSTTENILFPDLLLPTNYLQPGGIPGRTLRFSAAGRVTTLTTGATMTFSLGTGTTAVTVPTARWASSGAMIPDATATTAVQWWLSALVAVRSVGASGTVFCQGRAEWGAQRVASAAAGDPQLNFLGSAGAATPAAVTVDMTVPEYVALTAKWSLTTAYSITGHLYVVEALN